MLTARTLYNCFAEDPTLVFLFDQCRATDAVIRQRRMEEYFELITRCAIRTSLVYATDDAEAAAIWIPPGCNLINWWANVMEGTWWKFPLRYGDRMMQRLYHALIPPAQRALERFLGEYGYPIQAYFYLLYIGIRESARGRGLMKEVMLPVLQESDRQGVPCWLEATSETLVPIYQHFGFHVYDRVSIAWPERPSTPVQLVCMYRLPGTSSEILKKRKV